MSSTFTMRKITISLPQDLVAFADASAEKQQSSRSQAISLILAEAKARSEAQLAAEGYQFYAQEATDFAASSEQIVADSWMAEEWAMPQSQEQSCAG